MATRKIEYNNQIYYFNFTNFKELFTKELHKRNMPIYQLEEEIGDNIHLSKDAIHNWRFEKNGPSDINIIKALAKEFKLNNISILLEKKGDKKEYMLDDIQKLSVKRIYDSIIEFLDTFQKTNGFNDLWFELNNDVKDRSEELCDIALEHVDKLHLMLKKEYIFLKNTNIYKELENFEYNDIYDTFDGKLTYAYRFEALVNGHPTTDDDYYKALNKLNSIIDKYL